MDDAVLLMINGQRIPLRESADVLRVMTDIVSAVHEGGGFVHIDGRHGDQYDVLVTSATHVMVMQTGMAFEAGGLSASWTSSIDLDI